MKNEKLEPEITSEKPPRDIDARTFDLAVRIVRLCRTLMAKPGASRMIGNQLLKAGTSIGANVEEAQAGQSRADFVSKMNIALKEAREARYWIRILIGAELMKPALLDKIADEVRQITNILGAIVRTTRKRSKEAGS